MQCQMRVQERSSGKFKAMEIAAQLNMNNELKESPNRNRLWGYTPNPDDPHEFGEYMEDWNDYEWRKEQRRWIAEGRRRFGRKILKMVMTSHW